MNKEREIDGIRIVVNGEQYEAYKGTLQDQIVELQDRIDKAIEYIKQLEHSEWITFGRKILLEILQDKEQE